MKASARLSRPWPVRILAGAFALTAAAGLNVGLARGLTAAPKLIPLAVGLALIPAVAIAFGALVERHRALLAWAALGLPLTGLFVFQDAIPLPGATQIYWSDVLVVLALGAWLVGRLTGRQALSLQRPNRLLGVLLVPLAIAIALGVVRGSERYGASLIGQPFRIVLYAGIALALSGVTAERAWRAITIVFYAGAVVQTLWAGYYLATGGSQTDQFALSTGGSRVLAGGISVYLAGSLLCALLNLELERRSGRQGLHAAIAGLALFGIILTFSRSTWAALALIVPLLFLTRRRLRRSVFAYLPLAAVVLAAVALVVQLVKPDLIATTTDRIAGTSGEDENVIWRQRAVEVALEGVDREPWRGVGFGRTSSFVINNQVVEIRGDPHNGYVYLLAGGGLLALGSVLLLYAGYVLDALRRALGVTGASQALVIWSLAMWATIALTAVAGPGLSDPATMLTLWTVMALPGVVVIEARRRPAGALAPSPLPVRTL